MQKKIKKAKKIKGRPRVPKSKQKVNRVTVMLDGDLFTRFLRASGGKKLGSFARDLIASRIGSTK